MSAQFSEHSQNTLTGSIAAYLTKVESRRDLVGKGRGNLTHSCGVGGGNISRGCAFMNDDQIGDLG